MTKKITVTLYSLDRYQHWRLWQWDVTLYSLVNKCKHVLYAFIFRVVKWAMQEEMAWIWERACFLGFSFRPLAFPELYSWYSMHLIALCTALWVLFHIRDSPPGNVCHLVYLLLSTCTSPLFLHWLDSSCLGPPFLCLSPCLLLFHLFLFEFFLYPEA